MAFDQSLNATLSFPAVRPEEGEALSSWLARIARAHLLDLDHVADEIGCRVQLVDHAPDDETVGRIAHRIGTTRQVIRNSLHPLSSPATRPVHGQLDWRICSACFAADVEQGRVPYVRLAWLHPLSTICVEHRSALTIPTVGEWCALTTDEVEPPRQDHGLGDLSSEPVESLVRAARLVDPSAPTDHNAGAITREVLDLVDALGVQVSLAMGKGAAIALFEQTRRGRHVRPLSLDLQKALITGLDPADRLLFVRSALALRWPSTGYLQERQVLGDWFTRVVTATVPSGRRRIISDHPRDPLGLLAVALPAQAFHQLRQRAEGWSEEFRIRWVAAEQLAALAGLN